MVMDKKRIFIVLGMFLFLLTMVNAASVSGDLSTGLDLYYAYENGSGVVYDWTGSGDDGSISGDPLREQTGFIDNAFDYDGSGDVVKLPKNVDMNADWSISLWFKIDTYESSACLVKQRDEDNNDPFLDVSTNTGPNIVGVNLRDTDKDYCYGNLNADTYNERTWNTDEWYHYVLVYDHSEKNFTTYVNNTLYTNDVCPDYDQSGSRTYDDYLSLMGQTVSWQGDSPVYIDGMMDEFGLWEKPLSPSEVETLYNSGDGIPYENPDVDTLSPPTSVLSSPENGTSYSGNRTVDFQCKGQDNYNLTSLKFELWNNTIMTEGLNTSLLTDLVSYYEFDGTSGTVVDIHGGNNGTVGERGTTDGVTRGVDGVVDNAFDFDGVDRDNGGYVETTEEDWLLGTSGCVSGSFWMKSPGQTEYGYIFEKGHSTKDYGMNGWRMGFNTDGQINIQSWTDNNNQMTTTTDAVIDDNQWHHIVWQFGSCGQKIYIDGSLNVSNPSNTQNSGYSTYDIRPLIIGGHWRVSYPKWETFYNGQLDEMAFWERELTTTEVETLYNSGEGEYYGTNINNTLIYNETNTDVQNDTLESFTSTLSGGTNYTWNCLATDGSNQSAYAEDNWTIYTQTLENSPPLFTKPTPSNDTVDLGIDWEGVDFDLINESNVSVDTWFINDTNFAINSTGYLDNDTVLSIGMYPINVSVNNSDGALNSTIFTLNVSDITAPSLSNLNWKTTGDFTGRTLIYQQNMEYINVTSSDVSSMNVYLTVYDPSDTKIVDNQSMSNYTDNNYSYDTSFNLDSVGDWSFNVTSIDSLGNINTTSQLIEVTKQTQVLTDGWYGYTNDIILTPKEIGNLTVYGYDIYELTINSSNIGSDWETLKESINKSREQNIKIGVNVKLDYNYTDSTEENNLVNSISTNFSELTNTPYTDAMEYISFELVNAGSYTDSQKTSTLNTLSEETVSAISNEYVLFSKNYNHTDLDNAYISYTELLYPSPQTLTGFVNTELAYFRNTTTLNRIYDSIPDDVKSQAQIFYDNIISNLRSTPTGVELSNPFTANLTNGDLLVFNNQSAQNKVVDVSSDLSSIGKDAWDYSNNYLAEENTDLNFSVEIGSYNATVIIFEDIDHIQMDGLNSSNVYKGASSDKSHFNWTDGVRDGSWNIDGANDVQIELFDPHYQRNSFITYYGWLNASYIKSPEEWENYDVVIISDGNNAELDALNYDVTDFYAYISVADYNNSQVWTDAKKSEADDWLALNDSLHLFIDGLDTGIGGTNFSSRMKDLVDYVQIDKNRKAILNTYTAYSEFATWGEGGVMKESCVNRWNGLSAGNVNNYTRENWTLELEKADWYKNHDVNVYCMAFDNRTIDGTEQIKNYTELENIYFASKVLGYDDFYLSQPDFQYAHTQYVYDTGKSLDRSYQQLDSDPNTYYRTYEEGIVYYNTTSEKGWINDGRTVNNTEICLNVYDVSDTTESGIEISVNNRQRTGSNEEYTIDDSTMTVGVWSYKCIDITEEPTNGRYLVEAWYGDHTATAGQGFALAYSDVSGVGKHSWYDTSATDTFYIYDEGRNWMVNLTTNESKRASIDKTGRITQSELRDGDNYYMNLSSETSLPIEVWSYPFTYEIIDFISFQFKNSTGDWVNISTINTTTCDSNGPTFSSSTIETETYKSCYEQNGTHTTFRASAGSLSTREFKILGDDEAPVITIIPEDDSITYGDDWTGVDFNATDSSSTDWWVNDTTNFQINSTGYLDDNPTLSVDTYILNVSVNDTEGNTNSTVYTLTVDKTTPSLVLDITNSTYPTAGIINASGNNTGDGDVTYNLFVDGVNVGSGSDVDYTVQSSGTYTVVYNTTGGTNYTSESITKILNVEKTAPSLVLDITNSTYPTTGTINASESNTGDGDVTYNLFVDGVNVGSGSDIDHSIATTGTHTVVYNTTGGDNYTSESITKLLNVEKAAPDRISYSLEGLSTYNNSDGDYSVDNILSLAITPDGNYLVTSSEEDDFVSIMNITNKSEIVELSTYNNSDGDYSIDKISTFEITPDGNYLITSSPWDDFVSIMNITNKSEIVELATYNNSDGDYSIDNIRSLAITSDGNYLVTSSEEDDFVSIMNITNKSEIVELATYNNSDGDYSVDSINSLDITSDGNYLITSSGTDKFVSIMNITNKSEINELATYNDSNFSYYIDQLRSLEVTSDGIYLITSGSSYDYITILNITNKSEIVESAIYSERTGEFSIETIHSLSVSSDGNYLATSSYNDSTVSIMDISNKSEIVELVSYNNSDGDYSVDEVQSIELSSDGNYLATSSYKDDTVSIMEFGKTLFMTLNITNATNIGGIINASENNTGDGDLTYNLFVDGVNVGSGSDIDHSIETVGTYTIVYNTTGGTNYTSGSLEGALNVNASTPYIQYVDPTIDNGTRLTRDTIPVNVTLTETYFENVTFNFYRNGVLNESTTFTDDTRFYNKTGTDTANWAINVTTCTTKNKCNTTETRIYYVDTAAPEVNITAPANGTVVTEFNQSLDLNWTATDVNLDSCWINRYQNITDGLFGHYTFDESSGDVIDLVGINHADVTGSVTRDEPGKINTAYNFSGGYVNTSFTEVFWDTGLTLSMWVNNPENEYGELYYKDSDNGAWLRISYKNDTYYPENWDDCENQSTNSFIQFYHGYSWGSTWNLQCYEFTDDLFHHIVYRFNNSSNLTEFYIDGKKSPYDGDLFNPSIPEKDYNFSGYGELRIGDGWNGVIDEFSMFDKTLNESEILTLYEGERLFFREESIADCSTNTTTINYPTTNPDETTYYFFANDTFGRYSTDETTVVKSTEKPYVEITSPEDGFEITEYNQSFDLNWTVDPDVDSCWISDYIDKVITADFEDGTCGEWTCNTDGISDNWSWSGNYSYALQDAPSDFTLTMDVNFSLYDEITIYFKNGNGYTPYIYSAGCIEVNSFTDDGIYTFPMDNCEGVNTLIVSPNSGLTSDYYGIQGYVDRITFSLNESEDKEVDCNANTTTVNYPTTNPDETTYNFFANDTFGYENSTNVTVYKSTTEPNLDLDLSIGSDIIYNATQEFNITWNITTENTLDECWYNTSSNGTYTEESMTFVDCSQEWQNFSYPGSYTDNYTITFSVNDTLGNENSTTMTVYANTDSPFINLTYPEDGQAIYNQTYDVNWSINNSIEYGNCYVEYGVTGDLSNKTISCNETETTLLFDTSEDYQLVSVYANDSLGNLARSSQVNVTKSYDVTIVNITEPFGVLTGLYEPGSTINLSYTFIPVDGASLTDCWYYYNGSNTTITCTNGTQTITPEIGDEDIQVCAKDNLNNTGCDENSWEYQAVLIFNGTNKDSFTEGELMNFTAILYSQTGFTAGLIFNGTTYSPSINSNGDYYNLTMTSYAPAVSLDPETVSYKWTMDIGTNNYNTTEWDVDIYNISFSDVCNSTYPNLLMNITGVFDESTRQRIEPGVENVSVGIDVDIYTADKSSKVLEIRNFVTDFHHKAICTDLNFSLDYIVESNIDYYGNSTYSSKRIWYMTDGVLPLNGRNFTEISQQNISLYLLNPDAVAETPQDFIFRYYNENNQLESDAIIHVYRKDIGTEYGITEIGRSGADDAGNYPIDLSPDSEVYRQIVTVDGEIVYDTNKFTVLTCAQYENFYCVIDLGIGERSSSSLDTEWYEIDGGQYEVTKDYDTRGLTVDFVLEEKYRFNTTTLVVFSPSYNGSLQEVVRDSIQGSTGSVSVTVPAIAGGNYTSGQDFYEYYIYKEDQAVGYGTVNFANRAYEMFGDEFSLFLALLIIMSLGLMAASGGTLQIVFLIIGLIFVNILGLVRFDVEGTGMGVIIYFIAAGGIFIWKLAARRG